VLEDTAQADGASYKGRRLGSIGDVGCFSLQYNKILTCGEGGMVITDQEEVWKRAVMFHDVLAGPRNDIPEEEVLWGINFRMPELLAAVMLVQLKRLDSLLEAMRARKVMLRSGIEEVARRKGVMLHPSNDPEGDAAVALVFFMDNAESAGRVAGALRAENIGASVLYHPHRSDYHIYPHWTPIMEQRTWTPAGGPWRWAQREIHYRRDECPRSLDLLGRAVHLNVNPLSTNEDIEETVEGLNRVLNQLA
jgi:dTDP-4-amino-4,6-dideoxygalactose transaminase